MREVAEGKLMLLLSFSCSVMSNSLRYKTWSTGEGNGQPLQYFCLANPMDILRGKKVIAQKGYIGQVVSSLDFILNEMRSH